MSDNKTVLVFDTETTGLPHYKLPSDDPTQPHLVELAAKLYNEEDGSLIAGMSAIIKPDGWIISQEMTDIHGISHDYALEHGIPEKEAVQLFLDLYAKAGKRVAHNRSFDDKIMRIAIKRYFDYETADQYKVLPAECTAMLARPIMKLPASEAMKKTNFKNTSKTPDLTESLLHFTGRVLKGGHRAEVDVDACAEVYFKIKGVEPKNWWEQ